MVFRLVGDEARDAGDADNTAGYELRPAYPAGSPFEQRVPHRRVPLPGSGLRASIDVLHAARVQMREALGNARGSGMSWDDIGREIGLEKAATGAGMGVGRAAWRLAAMGTFPDEPDRESRYARDYGVWARWSCRTCGGSVSEGDREYGLDQRGHTAGCTRLAGELAADAARYDDGDDG